MTWWLWITLGMLIGAVVTLWLLHEAATFARSRPRAITIDLVGADLADPDDWLNDELRGLETESEARNHR